MARIGMSVGSFLGGYPDAGWFRELFPAMDEFGFDSCLVADRPTHPHPFPDALALMASAATSTRNIRIAGILVFPYRDPIPLARTLGTIDYMSDGRVVLIPAMGGDFPDEMRSCGVVERAHLRTLLEDRIEVCRNFWSGQVVEFDGLADKISGVQQLPPTPGPMPIWLAHRARSDRSLERTARMADGWLASWVSPKRLSSAKVNIQRQVEACGRSADSIEVAATLRVYIADTEDEAAERMAAFRSTFYGHTYDPDLVKHLQVVGPPDRCRERIHEFIKAGADTILIQLECEFPEFESQWEILTRDVLSSDGRTVVVP